MCALDKYNLPIFTARERTDCLCQKPSLVVAAVAVATVATAAVVTVNLSEMVTVEAEMEVAEAEVMAVKAGVVKSSRVEHVKICALFCFCIKSQTVQDTNTIGNCW